MTIRKAAFACAMTIACWLIAHAVNVYVSYALLPAPAEEAFTPEASASSVSQPDATQMAKTILTSGLFVLPANFTTLNPESAPPSSPPPLELAGKLKLLGTAMGERTRAYAAVEFVSDKKQRLYALDEEIDEVGQLIEIRRDGIKIRQGLREGELLLVGASVPLMPVAPSAGANIQKGNRMILDRRMLEESFGDLPKLLNESKAVPYYNTAGKIEGWQFLHFQPESVFGRLGLSPGDVLQRVNGVNLEDPSRILAFFQQAKHERTIKLDILRQSEPARITYDIR